MSLGGLLRHNLPKLAPLKRELKAQEYRRRYGVLKTLGDLQLFLQEYAHYDPDGRLPEVRRRLAYEERKARAADSKVADQGVTAIKAKQLQELEVQIANCKRTATGAQRAIERENEIGRISGFVDKRRLHDAGNWIMSCQEQIQRQYGQYRQAGGKKALAEIN